MDAHKQLTIGLFGFGVVGEGLYRILMQTPSLKANIKKVCIKHPGKKRNAPEELFTTDRYELLNDPEINVIVEVINETEPAFQIVTTALKNGKDVVSASKKMLAEHLAALLELQKETGRSVLYEAAACASIPVIRNLEEYYDNDLLHSIRAIVNGSTNFILTKIFEEKLSFKVNRQAFVDPAILETERDAIFSKCWLYIGHESELKNKGDIFIVYKKYIKKSINKVYLNFGNKKWMSNSII
jgi:homoserine dehydrogenase